ncbi:hypothetical protein BKA70DRAFT_215906 [Coprinopsis sp. MPI-PUGE-AT-0042]|nr:hypothetical protein BKA70DRAFT_215906 [Coprinopsis sp. MPI-PUGE-AT-0042]
MNMSDTTRNFPPDDDQAEKGSYARPDSPDSEKNERNEEFSRNAKSWALYLREAEENAKDQAEVWKTGLESLLIFAGLFAGVITTFLAESRKKLRLEDSEALLMDIRSALRNEPPSDAANNYKPAPDQLWVNGLWFASLLITLFSAIVAVLARSWLVNHLPISNRKEAKDAYKRWMLDERAERWKLQKVITGIPLLVQLAFFLFSLGLGIQTYQDNKTLGIFVLSLIAGGTLLYLVVTALPLALPPDSCPFQTPLSEVLHDLRALLISWSRRKGNPQSGSTPEAFSDILAKILYKDLINSGKPELADEAVLELSRRPPPPERLEFFAASDTPAVCAQRIRDCTSMRFDDHSQRDETIGAHLHVFLRLITAWEQSGRDQAIGDRFQKFIRSTGILGRWDFVPESQRALAYAARVPLYLASGRDFEDNASPGNEWETMVYYIQPNYRLAFVISACRGTVEGEQNIQRVSSFSVVHLITKGYLSVRQGQHTEWNLKGWQSQVRRLCEAYLGRLSKSIASMLNQEPNTFLSTPDKPQVPMNFEEANLPCTPDLPLNLSTFTPPGFPPANLRDALTAMELGIRSQGNTTLIAYGRQGHIESSKMETLLLALFGIMFDLSFKTTRLYNVLEPPPISVKQRTKRWQSRLCPIEFKRR